MVFGDFFLMLVLDLHVVLGVCRHDTELLPGQPHQQGGDTLPRRGVLPRRCHPRLCCPRLQFS